MEESAETAPEQKEMSDNVSVDRKQLLQILVQVENALEEVKQLRKEIKK